MKLLLRIIYDQSRADLVVIFEDRYQFIGTVVISSPITTYVIVGGCQSATGIENMLLHLHVPILKTETKLGPIWITIQTITKKYFK